MVQRLVLPVLPAVADQHPRVGVAQQVVLRQPGRRHYRPWLGRRQGGPEHGPERQLPQGAEDLVADFSGKIEHVAAERHDHHALGRAVHEGLELRRQGLRGFRRRASDELDVGHGGSRVVEDVVRLHQPDLRPRHQHVHGDVGHLRSVARHGVAVAARVGEEGGQVQQRGL